MAIRSLKTGTFSRSGLVGNPVIMPGSYESIATVTVGAGGTSSVDFTSIPSTYTHLQIRGLVKVSRTSGNENLGAQFNGDTGSNYSWHQLIGNGSGGISQAGATQSFMFLGETIGSWGSAASMFDGTVIDILDYKDTNKYKTTRTLIGADQNGTTAPNGDTGKIVFASANWRNTAAITSVKIYATSGTINEYSSFALYGVN